MERQQELRSATLNPLARLLGIILLAASAGFAHAYTLTNDDGKFTVELPAVPQFEKLNEKTEGDALQYVRYQWLVDQNEKAWIVSYSAFPKPMDKVYDAQVQASVNGTKGKLINQQDIEQRGIKGREIWVQIPE